MWFSGVANKEYFLEEKEVMRSRVAKTGARRIKFHILESSHWFP